MHEKVYCFSNGREAEWRFGLPPEKNGDIKVRRKGFVNYLKTLFKGADAYETLHNIPEYLVNADQDIVHGDRFNNKKVTFVNMSLRTLEAGVPNMSPRQVEELMYNKHQSIMMSRLNNQLRETVRNRTVKDFMKDEMQRDAKHIGESKNLATTGQKQYQPAFSPFVRRSFGSRGMSSPMMPPPEGDI